MFVYVHFWAAHGTRPELLARYDAPVADWLRGQLASPGSDRTAFLIMSDHGITPVRTGSSHLTAQPFMALWLPRRFLRGLDSHVESLRSNAARLLTNFDVHFFLQELVALGAARARGATHDLQARRRPPEPQTSEHFARSLLFALPPNRSCGDAGLQNDQCFCSGVEETWAPFAGDGALLRGLGELLVSTANVRASYNEATTVADLSVCQLQSLRSVLGTRSRANGGGGSRLEVVVETDPSGLVFKGAVDVSASAEGLGEPSVQALQQLTRYYPHEHCTPMGADARFCACNPHVQHRLRPDDRFWESWG